MGQERKFKKPTLWQKLTWDKSETAEAFDELIAKKKIKEMEDAIKHEFTWGNFTILAWMGLTDTEPLLRSGVTSKQSVKNKYTIRCEGEKLSYITRKWVWRLEPSY